MFTKPTFQRKRHTHFRPLIDTISIHDLRNEHSCQSTDVGKTLGYSEIFHRGQSARSEAQNLLRRHRDTPPLERCSFRPQPKQAPEGQRTQRTQGGSLPTYILKRLLLSFPTDYFPPGLTTLPRISRFFLSFSVWHSVLAPWSRILCPSGVLIFPRYVTQHFHFHKRARGFCLNEIIDISGWDLDASLPSLLVSSDTGPNEISENAGTCRVCNIAR